MAPGGQRDAFNEGLQEELSSLPPLDTGLATRFRVGGQVDALTQTPEPSLAPTPLPTLPPPTGDRAEVICSVMPCPKALRVALCESGPDYSAPFDGVHVGPFQISQDHVDKFAAHGWSYYIDGDDAYRNSVIALEILNEASGYWGGPWPTCGWR